MRKMKRVKTMGKKYILYNSLAGNGKCMYDVQALADTYPDAILKKMTEIASYAEFMGSLAEDNGFVVSDFTGINELVPHGVAADSSLAGQLAIEAGINMDLQGDVYHRFLKWLVETGMVPHNICKQRAKCCGCLFPGLRNHNFFLFHFFCHHVSSFFNAKT